MSDDPIGHAGYPEWKGRKQSSSPPRAEAGSCPNPESGANREKR